VKWIAARSELLGATPISDASNSGLRYHLATADAYMKARQRDAPTQRARRTRPPQAATTRRGAPLLSFRRP
jgi:hypothetical protein